jgi:hypothetical protein
MLSGRSRDQSWPSAAARSVEPTVSVMNFSISSSIGAGAANLCEMHCFFTVPPLVGSPRGLLLVVYLGPATVFRYAYEGSG